MHVAHDQLVGDIDSRLGDVPRGLHGALVQMPEALVSDVIIRMSSALVPDVHSPPSLWQLPASPV